MPRKRKTQYAIAGRPPKDPTKKIGTPARALLTEQVALALVQAAQAHGILLPEVGLVPSDIVRLYLYWGLKKDGLMSPELENDPTWRTLKQDGII